MRIDWLTSRQYTASLRLHPLDSLVAPMPVMCGSPNTSTDSQVASPPPHAGCVPCHAQACHAQITKHVDWLASHQYTPSCRLRPLLRPSPSCTSAVSLVATKPVIRGSPNMSTGSQVTSTPPCAGCVPCCTQAHHARIATHQLAHKSASLSHKYTVESWHRGLTTWHLCYNIMHMISIAFICATKKLLWPT